MHPDAANAPHAVGGSTRSSASIRTQQRKIWDWVVRWCGTPEALPIGDTAGRGARALRRS